MAIISGMNTALTLLTRKAPIKKAEMFQPTSAELVIKPNKTKQEPVDNRPPPMRNDPQFIEAITISKELEEGRLNPLSERARKYDVIYIHFVQGSGDERMLYRGNIVATMPAADGKPQVKKDGEFPDRQSAMIYAYNFAKSLSYAGNVIAYSENGLVNARAAIKGLNARIKAGDGDIEELRKSLQAQESRIKGLLESMGSVRRQFERAANSLANLFSFEGNGIKTASDGYKTMAGFTVQHGAQGKMIEVDAAGGLTLFDKTGKAYTPTEYNAAQPEGVIPELYNDEIVKADRLLPAAQQHEIWLKADARSKKFHAR